MVGQNAMLSIKGKIVFFVVVMMVILPVLFALYFTREYYEQGERVAKNVEETFQILNATIVRDLRNAMLANQIPGIRESILSMRAFKQIRSTTLLDSEGRIVMDDGGIFIQRGIRKKSSGLPARVLQEAFNKSEIQCDIQKNHSTLFYRYLVPFKNERECQKCHGYSQKTNGVLILNFQVPDFRQQTHHLAFLTIGFSLAGIALTSLLLLFLIKKNVVLPLHEIQYAMQHVASGDLTVQIPPRRNDEIGIVSDYFNDMVSKLKQSQDALEKSIREKERADRLAEIGMMASRVAHEVRNPLNVMEGAAYYLKNTYSDRNDVVKHASLIQKTVKKLDRFSRDLLSFAKPEELQKESVDFNARVREKAQVFLQFKNDKNVHITLNLQSALPKIFADAFKIDEVLDNILQNAYDASFAGGEISITTQYIHPHVCLSVKDNGCGIPAGQQQNVFEPFFSTKANGTGLGLCIVRKIVEAHGGGIKIASGENKGTEIAVMFPGGSHDTAK